MAEHKDLCYKGGQDANISVHLGKVCLLNPGLQIFVRNGNKPKHEILTDYNDSNQLIFFKNCVLRHHSIWPDLASCAITFLWSHGCLPRDKYCAALVELLWFSH